MGFIGWAIAFIGSYFVGRKVWWGFLLSIIANFFIGWSAIETKNPSLGAAVVVFAAMAIFNSVRWWRNPPVPTKGYDRWEIVFMIAGLVVLAASWFLFGSN
ncbi:MAG: hypothetical protein Q7S84_00455 [bacterium]|nr:hypothetical protein [bacterium]